MAFKCKLGLHAWQGCKCSECGKLRDELHKWDGCECSVCGRTRDEQHFWSGCKCTVCGKVRDEQHHWSDCKCTKCGKTTDHQHDWSSDCLKCSKCFKTRNYFHDWDGCKCNNCRKTRDEHHYWNGCKCTKCSKTRDEQHDWSKNCERCANCGKPKFGYGLHDWSKDCNKCAKCGETRSVGHNWGLNCEKCNDCSAVRINAHKWDGCECTVCIQKRHDFTKDCEKCSKCGKFWGIYHDFTKDCEKCSKCDVIRVNKHILDGCKCSICGKEMHDWSNDNNICSKCGISSSPEFTPMKLYIGKFDLPYAIFKAVLNKNSIKVKKEYSKEDQYFKGVKNPIADWPYIKTLAADFYPLNNETTLYINKPDGKYESELKNITISDGLLIYKTVPTEFMLITNLQRLKQSDEITQKRFFEIILKEILVSPTINHGDVPLLNIAQVVDNLLTKLPLYFASLPPEKFDNFSHRSRLIVERDMLRFEKISSANKFQYVEAKYVTIYKIKSDLYFLKDGENTVSL
jgi:hypothetical protein